MGLRNAMISQVWVFFFDSNAIESTILEKVVVQPVIVTKVVAVVTR